MRTLRVACAAALLLLTRPCVLAAKDACNQTVASYEEISSPESTPGLPVTCWYRLRTTRKDLVLRIRFKRFKVGVLINGTHCHQGYVQIVDGNAKTEVSNRKDPGMFCGEIEQPQTFISETSIVKILYHTDNYTDQTYFTFEARPDQQLEVYARYGHHPELYPNRRGEPVPGSYCERIFRDCRLQTCYVQSPAYPGVYPRGLYCRYHLNTRLPFIKLYIENEVFNIDGQRCENIMTCPMRPISSGTYNCPYDYIKIYDGANETSPLIGTFCGMGHFPFSIIGSKQDLLVEFSSSAAGPLLNTGFHFNVGSWPGHAILVGEHRGGCDWLLSEEALLASGTSEGIFQSVAHWYPPHTTCNYLIQARRGNIVRLYFPSFRINRIEAPVQVFEGDCGESLTLFDSSWADDSRIIKTFCDTFSKAMEKHDFVSTGNAMYVRFESKTGSYSGSSLYYWAHYDFFNDSKSGEPVAGTACDEVFASWQSTSGRLRSPVNTLVYKTQQGPVQCSYRFITDRRLFARVILTIESMAFKDNPFGNDKCTDCIQDHADKLIITETEQNGSMSVISCLCHGGLLQPPLTVVSRSEYLSLELVAASSHASTSYFKQPAALFQARFQFVHPPVCGPAVLGASAFGHITFPQVNSVFSPVMTVLPVRCIWELQVHKNRDLWLNFEKVEFDGQIIISIPKRSEPLLVVDGENFTSLYDLPVLTSDELSNGDGVLELKLELVVETWNERVNLQVTWTELGRVPTDARKLSSGVAPVDSEDFRERTEEYCEFFCPGDENYCIPNILVCNSVTNCPNVSASADEAASLCSQDQDSAAVNWITVTVGGVVGGVLFLACFIVIFKACCCRRRRDKHHQMASRDMYMR